MKSLKALLVVITTAASVSANAYGNHFFTDVKIKKISCDYKIVRLELKRAWGIETQDAVQNLSPLVIEGEAHSGNKSLGRKTAILSINGVDDSLLSDTISYPESTGERGPFGAEILRVFVADGQAFRNAVLKDKISQCQELKSAFEKGTLIERLNVHFSQVVKVTKDPMDLQQKNTTFAKEDNVVKLARSEKLKAAIKQRAECYIDYDGRHDGNRMVELKPGGIKFCK